MQGEESILWFPLERKILKNEHDKVSRVCVDKDSKLKVNGSFSCKLRPGVAPWIQSKKKEFSLDILATHVLFKDEKSKLIEIDLKDCYEGNRLAIEWRLH